jgi:hypothetical protein
VDAAIRHRRSDRSGPLRSNHQDASNPPQIVEDSKKEGRFASPPIHITNGVNDQQQLPRHADKSLKAHQIVVVFSPYTSGAVKRSAESDVNVHHR